MPQIDVTRPHDLGRDGARRAAEAVVEELRRHHHFHFDARWEGDTLLVDGSGFHGRLEAHPTSVRVAATLSLVLRPLRRRIRDEIEGYLDRYVG